MDIAIVEQAANQLYARQQEAREIEQVAGDFNAALVTIESWDPLPAYLTSSSFEKRSGKFNCAINTTFGTIEVRYMLCRAKGAGSNIFVGRYNFYLNEAEKESKPFLSIDFDRIGNVLNPDFPLQSISYFAGSLPKFRAVFVTMLVYAATDSLPVAGD